MKKRKIAVLLALTLTAASIIGGCKTKDPETEKTTETQAATEKKTEAPQTETKPTEKQTEKKKQPESETKKESESNKQSESNAGTQPQTEAGQNGGSSAGTSTGGNEGTTAPTDEETRWFFDKDGNTVYTTQNSAGKWVDKNGTEYYFYENGVEDSNGETYTYDPPSWSSGSDSNASSLSSSDPDAADGETYYDFFDDKGNHIYTKQNENGEWVDDNGNKYVFGEKGVTDSNGNFYPY